MKLENIKKIAVIGSGLMGPGIALDFAKAGYAVSLCARRQASLDSAQKVIHANLLTLAKNKVVRKLRLQKSKPRSPIASASTNRPRDADFMVECINEKKDLKTELFKQLTASAALIRSSAATPAI